MKAPFFCRESTGHAIKTPSPANARTSRGSERRAPVGPNRDEGLFDRATPGLTRVHAFFVESITAENDARFVALPAAACLEFDLPATKNRDRVSIGHRSFDLG
jgi:hypothetical protein